MAKNIDNIISTRSDQNDDNNLMNGNEQHEKDSSYKALHVQTRVLPVIMRPPKFDSKRNSVLGKYCTGNFDLSRHCVNSRAKLHRKHVENDLSCLKKYQNSKSETNLIEIENVIVKHYKSSKVTQKAVKMHMLRSNVTRRNA